MANRFPLIVDNATQTIRELPSGDNIDLTGSDALFGDNDKAIFGAGSDLQIYHDGSASYIKDLGSGPLAINTNGSEIMLTGQSGAEYMLRAIQDGAVQLYYDNSLKLATTSTGIDVTGLVDASDLFRFGVDNSEIANNYLRFKPSGAAYIDHSTVGQPINFRVSSASTLDTTPLVVSSTGIDVTGTVTADSGYFQGSNSFINDTMTLNFAAPNGQIAVKNSSGSPAANMYLYTTDTSGNTNLRQSIGYNGDISFYEDTGTTPKFFWDASAESLGLGSASPDSGRKLHIEGGDTTVGITLKDTAGSQYGITNDNNVFTVRNDSLASDRLVIDSSGNVGIGTSSPSSYHSPADNLVIGSSGDNGLTIVSGTSSGGTICFADGTSGGAQYAGFIDYQHNGNYMRFGTNVGTERMRIDASGNLLVGKTAADTATVGAAVFNYGMGAFTRSGSHALDLNRTTSDGAIINLRKDNTTVGSIGAVGGDVFLGTGVAGLRFADANPSINPHNTTTNATNDNAIDLGTSSARFKDIYAANALIQTSDANEKQDIAELDEAERRVAVAAKGLLRKFRWKDAVAEKGDDARIHFGIIAQDLQAAFEAEGLDAGRYAMFIHTTWTDEETGEERSRMGVRYSELLAFIIAAI